MKITYCNCCSSTDLDYSEYLYDPHFPVCNRCGNYVDPILVITDNEMLN